MRVIGGNARGRRLKVPKGEAVRPTSGRVKEALFNILPHDLSGIKLLDLFAGTGNVSIEAISRGAAEAILIDSSDESGKVIRENLRRVRFADRTRVWIVPASRALRLLARRGESFDIIFLDPPYQHNWVEACVNIISRGNLLRPSGTLIAEHSAREQVKPGYGSLILKDQRNYGDTLLSFFRHDTTKTPAVKDILDMVQKSIAIYPGSFDPITNGHVDLVKRALRVFDKIIVAIATNPGKDTSLFSVEERLQMIREVFRSLKDRVEADSFQRLLVDYAERKQAPVIIRGLRAVSDFEYEFQMAMMNHRLKPEVETFFMMTGESEFYISSRLVKEVVSLGGDVEGLVPIHVLQNLKRKLKQG